MAECSTTLAGCRVSSATGMVLMTRHSQPARSAASVITPRARSVGSSPNLSRSASSRRIGSRSTTSDSSSPPRSASVSNPALAAATTLYTRARTTAANPSGLLPARWPTPECRTARPDRRQTRKPGHRAFHSPHRAPRVDQRSPVGQPGRKPDNGRKNVDHETFLHIGATNSVTIHDRGSINHLYDPQRDFFLFRDLLPNAPLNSMMSRRNSTGSQQTVAIAMKERR